MKVELQDSFVQKLNRQVAYIAADKPSAARKFKNDLLDKIKDLCHSPFKYKKSIYFDSESIRDLTFKGYTVVYKIDETNHKILIFGFIKYEEKL